MAIRLLILVGILVFAGCELILQREYDERTIDLTVESDEHGCYTAIYFTGDKGERHRGKPAKAE